MIPCSTPIVAAKVPNPQKIRRRSIVAAARKAFLRHGYGQTSMSGIAAALGGSKTTLWSYFRNKQDLFAAVVDDQIERYGEALRMDLPEDADLAETLIALGVSTLESILRPEVIALHRVVVGEAGHFPQLGQMLWQRGAERGQQRAEEWLGLQMAKGRLRAADPRAAASHFLGLCQSGGFYRHLLGAAPRLKREEIEKEIQLAVEAFLAAYSPAGAAG